MDSVEIPWDDQDGKRPFHVGLKSELIRKLQVEFNRRPSYSDESGEMDPKMLEVWDIIGPLNLQKLLEDKMLFLDRGYMKQLVDCWRYEDIDFTKTSIHFVG